EALRFSGGVTGITFAPGLTGVLPLALGALKVTAPVRIDGPGADQLTISGEFQSRVFVVDDGNSLAAIPVTLTGLTVAHGRPPGTDFAFGGGIQSFEDLALIGVVVTGNDNPSGIGGGV